MTVGRLLFLFLVLPLVELYLLFWVAQHILGAAGTIGLILLTGLVGVVLVKHQGLRTLRRIQEDLAAGLMPTARLFDGLCILLGGALLLTPGLLTDLAGLLLLVPWTRAVIKEIIRRNFLARIARARPRSEIYREFHVEDE
jgi:UPF0716 protein FxsA